MKPPPFQYFDPTSIADAIGLLGKYENAKVIAGGQSMMPMLNMRFIFPDQIVDLNSISEISGIGGNGEAIEFGAMTRQREIERSDLVARKLPILIDALRHVGHIQTRNRGTIGGSLSHLDPAAELVAMATLYEATITVAGPSGERSIPFSEFVFGYMTPGIEPDEIVTKVRFDGWGDKHGYGFCEYARRHGDFAIVSASSLLEIGEDGKISRAALVLGGADSVAFRLTEVEELMIGETPSDALYAEVAARCRGIEAMADALVSAEYRQHLAGVLGRRAVEAAVCRAGSSGTQ